MNTLESPIVAGILEKLHQEADAADREHVTERLAMLNAPGFSLNQAITDIIAEEKADYRASYRATADNFLAVSPAFGKFVYSIARACRARRIVEFGTSMGISTLYLAAALRDNGGGTLIGSEFVPDKVASARKHLAMAGLNDLVDIREGDALETLKDVGEEVDLALIDGAFSLYLPVLKLIGPSLRKGAIVLGENAFDPQYQAFIHDPTNGYLSQPLPIGEGRGNEFTVKVG